MVEASVPLWKQFYEKQKEESLKQSGIDENKERELQGFYKYLLRQRKEQDIPPIFGMLTGPTLIRPYRMEETKMILGRVSPSKREAHVHVGSLSKISHKHCLVEWDRSEGAYVLEVISGNGVEIGHISSVLQHYQTVGQRITLPNPCQILIQSIPLFFQCFYVSDKPQPEQNMNLKPIVTAHPVTSPIPMSTRSSRRNVTQSAITSTMFKAMIEEALEDAGGKATQKEIVKFIDLCHPEVEQKKNWKNSVSGILSSNPAIFSTEPALLPSGKRARYALWGLRRITEEKTEIIEEVSSGVVSRMEESVEPPEKKQKVEESESDSDEDALQIDDA